MATKQPDFVKYECEECFDVGWVPRAEVLYHSSAEQYIETWWEPCVVCNDEAKRVPQSPDTEPIMHTRPSGFMDMKP